MRVPVINGTPVTLAASHLGLLAGLLSAARAGDVEGVHQARVATRRLRELIPLIGADDALDPASKIAKRLGRALGRVRELDVLGVTLDDLGRRATFATATIQQLAAQARREVGRERRAMVKRIDRLDLSRVHAALARHVPRRPWRAGVWKERLRERIGGRATDARAAMEHASAVYMPTRSHNARIALKKLRYAIEVAEETGLWRPPHLLKDLRRAQGGLGDIHDLQILVERVDDAPSAADAREAQWLKDLVVAEIEMRHRAFLEAVPRLHGAMQACARWAGRRRFTLVARPAALLPAAATSIVTPIVLASRRA